MSPGIPRGLLKEQRRAGQRIARSFARSFRPQAAQAVKGGRDKLPVPPRGLIRLRATLQPGLGLVAEAIGTLDPAGYGGYAPVAREGRVGLVSYDGRDPDRLPVQILLDRWPEQQSLETELDILEQMAGRDGRPPQLIIEGIGVPRSYAKDPAGRWVIQDDLTWNEVRRRPDTVRCYADVSFTLLRLERPDADAITDATTRRFHEVRKGARINTLDEIARYYRTSWTRLRELNKGDKKIPADPSRKLPAGTKVRLS